MHTLIRSSSRYCLLICGLVLLAGCLTEVDPRDVDFEPVLVVESFPQPDHPVTLQLTRTTPLWDPSRYLLFHHLDGDSSYVWDRMPDYVAGAEVQLRVNDTSDYRLREDSAGFYSLPLATYRPASQDRLHLRIQAGQLSVQAETVLPQQPRDYTFSIETTAISVDSAITRITPDTQDLLYSYRQEITATLTFADPADQSDYYLFKLEQRPSRTRRGDPFSGCIGGPLDHDVPRYDLLNDYEKQGASFAIQRGWGMFARFPLSLFPDAQDRHSTCTLHATLVQYGPEYERFLEIDYQPVSSETGSNIQGGLGLFTGIVIRDTTIVFELGTD